MSKRRPTNGSFRHVGLGIEFAAILVGGCLIGAWVDRHFATAPWGIVIGATVSLVGGFYNFLRSSMRALREARESEPNEAQGPNSRG